MKRAGVEVVMAALCILVCPVKARAQQASSPPAAEIHPPDDTELMLVAVTLNDTDQEGQFFVARRGDSFFVRVADLAQWRFQRPKAAIVVIEGEDYLSLSALPGVEVQFDAPRQRLVLTISAELFEAQRISASASHARPMQLSSTMTFPPNTSTS